MDTLKRAKEQLIFLLLCLACAVIIIVNNGIILTDGTDEGKHLPRKYNDL